MAAAKAVMATRSLAAPGPGGTGAFMSCRTLRKLSSFCERYPMTRFRGKDVCSASLRDLGPGGRRAKPGSLLSLSSALSTIASWDSVRTSGCCNRLCCDSSVATTAVCAKALTACSFLSAALFASLRAALALAFRAASALAASAALSTLGGALRITKGIVAAAPARASGRQGLCGPRDLAVEGTRRRRTKRCETDTIRPCNFSCDVSRNKRAFSVRLYFNLDVFLWQCRGWS